MSKAFERVLFLDTAMAACAVGFYDAASAAGHERSVQIASGQAEVLLPLVEEILAEAGAGFQDLDAVLTTSGPGAFTGMRIGLSTARALGLALDIPVFGIQTTDALALCYRRLSDDAGPLAVIVESKRSDFYAGFYEAGRFAAHPEAMEWGSIVSALKSEGCNPKWTLIGDGSDRFSAAAVGEDYGLNSIFQRRTGYDGIRPLIVAAAFCDQTVGDQVFVRNPEAVYLRPADVSQTKKAQRILADQ